MSSLSSILQIATSGLQAHAKRGHDVAHNIANANTDGYKSVKTQYSSQTTQVTGRIPHAGSGVAIIRQTEVGADFHGVEGGQKASDVDLGAALVGLIQTKHAYAASARAFAKGAELQKSLLDIVR